MIDSNNTLPLTKYEILLIGDSCVDEYVYGSVERISPEAPVPVLKIDSRKTVPGMAANVKLNLENLGCAVDFITNGEQIVKTRFVDSKYGYHLLRADDERELTPWSGKMIYDLETYDAVVISDYAKGFLTYELMERLRSYFTGPIFIDTKKQDLARFEGCFVKINEYEYKRRTSDCEDMIVTLGPQGSRYRGHIYPAPKVEVFDVCGAGDTFLAALVVAYLEQKDMGRAIEFANKAASITVTHSGNYAPTLEEIR